MLAGRGRAALQAVERAEGCAMVQSWTNVLLLQKAIMLLIGESKMNQQ
jgi:hypothetical protein